MCISCVIILIAVVVGSPVASLNFGLFLHMLGENFWLVVACIFIFLFDMCFSFLNILVLRFFGSGTRVNCMLARCLLVWIIALMMRNPERFKVPTWESFSFLQVFGFFIFGFGFYVYYEIGATKKCFKDKRKINYV